MPYEREFREMAYIPRWGIARMNRQQDVAQHSYFVILYAIQTCRLMDRPDMIGPVAEYAAMHDVLEVFTSDISAPAKRQLIHPGEEGRLEDHMFQTRFGQRGLHYRSWPKGTVEITKFADILDAVMKLCEEWQMGNRTLGDPALAYHPNTAKIGSHSTVADDVCPILKIRWMEMCEALSPEPSPNGHFYDMWGEEVVPAVKFEALWNKGVVPALKSARQDVSHIFKGPSEMPPP